LKHSKHIERTNSLNHQLITKMQSVYHNKLLLLSLIRFDYCINNCITNMIPIFSIDLKTTTS